MNEIQKALKRAFDLGQKYWIQADSDSFKQNAKAHDTLKEYEALSEQFADKVPRFALKCSVCQELQFDTPSGMVCRNGHGGAPSETDINLR